MSEVLRTYSGTRHARRRFRGPMTFARWGIPLLLLAAFIWVPWTTRDSHSMARLIPRGEAYQAVTGDFLKKRHEIAASGVWSLLPEDWPAAELPVQLSNTFGVPEWVLNNVIFGVNHLSGNDLQNGADLLFVTKMSRIGCLIERFHRFIPGFEEDDAGGLRLGVFPEGDIYYAVRGRVLAASRSRGALIRSLTLRPEDALTEDELTAATSALGDDELMHGTIMFAESDPLGEAFSELRFSLRMAASSVRLSCRGPLRGAWKSRLAPLMQDATPKLLTAPTEGIVTLSANFGKPAAELWAAVRPLLPERLDFGGLIPPAPEGAELSLPGLLDDLLPLGGPGVRIMWTGIDVKEMFPVPTFALFMDGDAALLEEALEEVPGLTPRLRAWDPVPRRDAERPLVATPLAGGPSLEFTVAPVGNALLLSTSRADAERMLAAPPPHEPIGQAGNLYVRARPLPGVQAVVDAGLEFAYFGALRDHTPESFREAAKPWLDAARKVEEVAGLAAVEEGELRIDLRLVLGAAS